MNHFVILEEKKRMKNILKIIKERERDRIVNAGRNGSQNAKQRSRESQKTEKKCKKKKKQNAKLKLN